MIDDLQTWIDTMPGPTKSPDWATAIADWVDSRVTNKMELPGIGGPGLTYTFDKSTFATQLAALTPNKDQVGSMAKVAAAWAAAIGIAVVAPGSYIGTATPATTWSVVTTTVIDPPSILLGKAKIEELGTAALAKDKQDSEFPVKLREAFLLLTITTSGLDSTPPPSGPLPLVDPARAVA